MRDAERVDAERFAGGEAVEPCVGATLREPPKRLLRLVAHNRGGGQEFKGAPLDSPLTDLGRDRETVLRAGAPASEHPASQIERRRGKQCLGA